METKANYALVGFFVIAGIIGIFAFAFWLAGNKDGEHYVNYTVYFEESVNGLNEGSVVRYRGVNVGTVDNIEIYEDNQDLIDVTISALADTPITQDTKAQLKFQGITGIAFIELVGESKGPAILKKASEDYPVIQSDTSELAKLFASTPQLIENVNEITTRLNILLSVDNIEGVTNTIENLENFSDALGGEDDNVKQLVSESAKTIRQFRLAAQNFNAASADLSKISDAVSELISSSKDNVINFSDSGLRAITRFFTEGRKTAQELKDAARALKENPSRILYPQADEKGQKNAK